MTDKIIYSNISRLSKYWLNTCDAGSIVKCNKHRKYQAKRKPRVCCEACWFLFFKRKGMAHELDNGCKYNED